MLPITINLPDNFLSEETRCDYLITRKYKELWAVELDLLSVFDKACKRLNIQYFAIGGTMLGAVRHNGMIPWDDDIDVAMLRQDYEKLCENASMFEHPYFLQTEFTDNGSLRGHAQLRNSLTTGILQGEVSFRFPFNQGIFIDIFPLDNLPDNVDERKDFIRQLKSFHKQLMRIRNISSYNYTTNSIIKRMICFLLTPGLRVVDKHFNLNHKLYVRYEKLMKKYNTLDTKEVGILALTGALDRFCWSKSVFTEKISNWPFEMMEVPVPDAYDSILKKTYGNWHELIKGGSYHGGLIFDVHKSYKVFFKENL